MTANKPGTVNQRPLYGCTSCFEDYTWPAGDLRVYDGECWCDLCWDERRWDFQDQPSWNDLELYTPALQAECEKLRKDAERYRWWRNEAGNVLYGDEVIDLMGDPDAMDRAIDAALAKDRGES